MARTIGTETVVQDMASPIKTGATVIVRLEEIGPTRI